MSSICWLVGIAVLIGIEAATMALTTIWFAGGAFAAFILSLFGASLIVQLTAFVAVSFLLLFFTRPFAVRFVNKKTVKTNAEGLIGCQARVTEAINNEEGTGAAVVNGQEWTARAKKDGSVYPAGTKVTILDIQGVKLIVGTKEE